MPACCVINCKNHHRGGFSLIMFPKDESRRNAWRSALGDLGPNWSSCEQKQNNYRICNVHFQSTDWVKYAVLKKDAVPSLFPNKNTVPKKTVGDLPFSNGDHPYCLRPSLARAIKLRIGRRMICETPRITTCSPSYNVDSEGFSSSNEEIENFVKKSSTAKEKTLWQGCIVHVIDSDLSDSESELCDIKTDGKPSD